jgi:hypothetical protein
MDYLVDGRYPWAAICEREFGCWPVQILDESNAIGHVAEYEGDPRRRPLTREELVLFFDHLDARVTGRRALRRKGSLAAFRDSVVFKAIYAWGLRRQEAVRLDLSDFGRNPHRPSFGEFGRVSVRYGKASRGSAPKRRNVLTVFPWSVEGAHQFVVLKPGVRTDHDRAGVLGAADAGEQLVDESGSAALGVRLALAVADVQHLAGVRADGEDRVIPELAGVPVAGALLLLAVDLADEAVEIDHQRPVPGSRPGLPRARERDIKHAVELADMPERERPQERSERGGGHHPVPENELGRSGSEQVHVINRVRAGEHPVHQRHHFAAGQARTRQPGVKPDRLVHQLLEP